MWRQLSYNVRLPPTPPWASGTSAGAPLRASAPEVGSERALRMDGAQKCALPEPAPWRLKTGTSTCQGGTFTCAGCWGAGLALALALGSTRWKLEGRVVPQSSLLGSHCTPHEQSGIPLVDAFTPG